MIFQMLPTVVAAEGSLSGEWAGSVEASETVRGLWNDLSLHLPAFLPLLAFLQIPETPGFRP